MWVPNVLVSKSGNCCHFWAVLGPDKGTYIHDDHTKGGGGFLEISHVCKDFIVFEQLIYCSFLQTVGVGIKKLAIFCRCHKWMTPNYNDYNDHDNDQEQE